MATTQPVTDWKKECFDIEDAAYLNTATHAAMPCVSLRGASLCRNQEVRRLLERLSAEAASRGMAILRLETDRSRSEAKHLYERAGFVEVEPFNNEPYAHHWFQKDLRHK
jgi:GNAT superfamily N-acetyltransferase